jgi:hypothetical protein
MEYRIRLNLATTAAILALGVTVSAITSTVVASRAYVARGRQAQADTHVITVKGSTRKRIVSDKAVWRIEVRSESRTLPDGFDALEDGLARVRAFLKDRAFESDAITVSAIDTDTHYGRDSRGNMTRDVEGYGLSRTVTVSTPDVHRVQAAAGAVTELIRSGVLVVSGSPEYYYGDLATLKIELMGEASRDARARAENIAESTGGKLGEIRSARMGVLQIVRPESTEVSSWGMYDTSTIDKDVRAVVTAEFQVRG